MANVGLMAGTNDTNHNWSNLPMRALIFLVVLSLYSTTPMAATQEEILGNELCSDPIGRGYTTILKDQDLPTWVDNVIADLSEIRATQTIQRASMTGGQIIDSLDSVELKNLASSDFDQVIALLSVASDVDPFGTVGEFIFATFPDGGASETGFGTARLEPVPRWKKIGLTGQPNQAAIDSAWNTYCPEVKL